MNTAYRPSNDRDSVLISFLPQQSALVPYIFASLVILLFQRW